MSEIIEILSKIGFTTNEANIYKTLLENPGLTVYQISKELGLSRSSIYPIMNKLYQEGTVVLQNGVKDHYYAIDSKTLIKRIESDFSKAIVEASPLLSSIEEKEKLNNYRNLLNQDAIIAKAKSMMLNAKKEIVMNTDLDLDIFNSEIALLKSKNIRIVVFSFRKQENPSQIELYSHNYSITKASRIMLVTDANQVLVASSNHSNNVWIGTYTNNMLMTKIIYEHIHHDIYLFRIKEKLGVTIFDNFSDIMLNTLNEKGDIYDSRSDQK